MEGVKPAATATVAAAGALLVTALFFGDGTSNGRLFWIGALAVIAVAVLTFLGPVPVPGRAGTACLAVLAALTAWVGLSMSWSIAPDLSWAAFNRLVAYSALALLGLLACRVPRPARSVATGLAVLVALVLGWALLGKVIPSLFPDGARVARLRNPIGYWNALALVAATAVPLGLWAASRRHPLSARVAGALLVYLAELVAVLTYSRAGIAVAVVAAFAWLALDRDRLEALATLVLVTPVAGLVSLWAFSRPAITDDLQSYSSRVNDGAWFGVVICLGAAIVGALAWFGGRVVLDDERRRRYTRRLGIVVVSVTALGIVLVLAVKSGKVLDEFRGAKGAQVTQSPNRLSDLSSSNRWTWWQEAWQLWKEDPGLGKGADTFEVARRKIRVGSIVTTEPHDLPLQFLAETGVPGFLLLLGLFGTGAAAAVAAVRRLEGDERAAAGALAVGVGAFALHSLVEIHWEFVAVAGPAFFVLGVLIGLGARRTARPPAAAAGLAAVVSAGALYSLTAPYAAGRLVDSAYAALGDGRTGPALSDAGSAHWLNPLATDPLFARGDTEVVRRNDAAALRAYRAATRLQPENSSTWYALGSFEFYTGRYQDAYRDLSRAWALDRYGPAGRPGGLLDQARAKVEGR